MMEDLCRKLPLIKKIIFKELDNQSCVTFKDASRVISNNLKNERFYWIRVLRSHTFVQRNFKDYWAKAIRRTPTEFVKEMVALTEKFCKSKHFNTKITSFSPHDIAAYCGNADLYKHFVEKTHDINPKEPHSEYTPLHFAACYGKIEICQFIIADLNDKNPKNKDGVTPVTPLYLAANCFGYFDNRGDTPLHLAASMGHLNICKLIIKGVQVKNPENNDGDTPLHLAAEHGHLDICKLIIKDIEDKNPGNNYGDTPLHFAASKGHWNVCKFIIKDMQDKNPGNLDGDTPLHVAAGKGHLDICKLIIANVQNKNPRDNSDSTPLHLAAFCGYLDVYKLIAETQQEKNPKDDDGLTPLDLATKKGHLNTCKFIIESAEKNHGKTLLG